MFTVKKVCPMYGTDAPDHVEHIGAADTLVDAFEVLRAYFLSANRRIVAHPDAPLAIVKLAAQSIVANDTLVFSTNEDGVVSVNGRAYEMDYFTITTINVHDR